MDLVIVDVVQVDEETETAVVLIDGTETVIPVWEIAGYVRVSDNHQKWQYAVTNEI